MITKSANIKTIFGYKVTVPTQKCISIFQYYMYDVILFSEFVTMMTKKDK